MKLPRRKFLHLATVAAALPAVSRIARADTYPSRPVHILVGVAVGGVADTEARLMGQWLSERIGRPFVIETRLGSATNLATELAVQAAPDGYTLLAVGTPNAVNATLYDNLNFDFMRDIAPVAGIMRVPNVMSVNPSFPARTVPEFIAYARANPGKISFGSGGSGTSVHMAAELFKLAAKVNMVHVPYRGEAPALTDLLGGQVQVVFGTMPTSIALVKADKVRALAVTSATRSALLPDIPTLSEFLPGYEASFFGGFGAPKNTPPEIVERLNKEINAGLSDPNLKARLTGLGGTALPGSPAEFGKLIADETEKWAKVIKSAGIKP